MIDIADHETCGSKTQEKIETCHRCHPDEGRDHFASVHMINDIKCADCHSDAHAIMKWDGNKKSIVDKCLGCHDGDAYLGSVHGRAVMAGNEDSAVCTDCHGTKNVHRIEPLGEPGTQESRAFHTDTCHVCHADAQMMKRNRVPAISVLTYEESYHGKVESLGSALAAGCADCHTAHNVSHPDDPGSSINPANLVETCGACHPGSSIKFAQFFAHADHADKENFPILYYTWLLMTSLLVSVFAVFWVHTFLWWRKAYWARRERLMAGEYDHHPIAQPLKPYRRFNWFDKFMHLLMVVSFLGLVITGLPLKFHAAPWAAALIQLLGGPHMAGFVHRVCAVITFVYFGSVFAYIVYYLLIKDTGETLLQKLFGPDSLFPNLRDIADFRNMFSGSSARARNPPSSAGPTGRSSISWRCSGGCSPSGDRGCCSGSRSSSPVHAGLDLQRGDHRPQRRGPAGDGLHLHRALLQHPLPPRQVPHGYGDLPWQRPQVGVHGGTGGLGAPVGGERGDGQACRPSRCTP